MMKTFVRTLVLLLAIGLSSMSTMFAQSLNVHCGNLTYSYPYNEATTMEYQNGEYLVINGEQYALSEITGITGSSEQMADAQVCITWDGAEAHAVMSGDLRGRISITFDNADVMVADTYVPDATGEHDAGLVPEVTFHLSGTSTDGRLQLSGSYKCTLSLEGLSLQSNKCPIYVDNGKRINIILADGSQNTICDGTNNLQKSAFHVKGHAEFSGGGTLNITGTQRHAYSSNEYTLLKHSFNGVINVLGAASDGMHVEQYYEQRAGSVIVGAVQGDCIDVSSTTDMEDENNGQVIVSGGILKLKATADDSKCVKSETSMTISGGQIELTCAGNGSKGLSVGTDLLIEQDVNAAANERPTIYMYATGGEYVNPQDASDTSKCRGIKTKGNMTFDGGMIERDLQSTLKATAIVKVDGTYTYKKGILKNCSIQ